MAPPTQKQSGKPSADASGMKQKSLMSFFGKASAGTSDSKVDSKEKQSVSRKPTKFKNASKSAPGPVNDEPSSDPPAASTRTPLAEHASQSSVLAGANNARSSDYASSVMETPPTSDPVDIDMLSPDEDDKKAKAHKVAVSRMYAFHVDCSHLSLSLRIARNGKSSLKIPMMTWEMSTQARSTKGCLRMSLHPTQRRTVCCHVAHYFNVLS